VVNATEEPQKLSLEPHSIHGEANEVNRVIIQLKGLKLKQKQKCYKENKTCEIKF